MNEPFGESDWKYIRSLHDGMLHTLCERINGRAAGLAASRDGTAHERYLKLYRHIKRADGIIADCFNDWRRSQFGNMILQLRKNQLLTDEHVGQLTPETQEWLRRVEAMQRK